MTKTEKDALIDALIEDLEDYTFRLPNGAYIKVWNKDDVKYAILNLPEEEPEEEYNRLAERFIRVNADWAQLRNKCEALTRENEKMRIAIKTIEFVTGRKLEL